MVPLRTFDRPTRLAVSVALVLACAPSVASAEPAIQRFRTEREALELAFPDADRFETHELAITGDVRAALEERLREPFPFRRVEVHDAHRGEVRLGRAVVTEEVGKYRPITFLVAVDPSNAVKRVELLVFREPYGAEVAARAFLAQYEGRRTGDRLRVGKDIDGLTGATLSAAALSKGIRRTLYFFEVIDPYLSEPRTSGGSATRDAP